METKDICGVVVLYNPDLIVYENICTYLDNIETLFVFDNSEVQNPSLVLKLSQLSKIRYIYLGENKGIAYALNYSLNLALNSGFLYCLTMDQDSSFKKDSWSLFKTSFDMIEDLDSYGIVSFDVENIKHESDIVKTWITSGNVIILKNYMLTPGFDEKLFIDYVDFDLNEKFHRINKKIKIIKGAFINHQIGNPIKKRFLLKTFFCMNHAPIRYYYRYRNSRYLYLRDKNFYKNIYLKEIIIQIPKMLLFEKNKLLKLKMILKGRRDAKLGKMGKYHGK